MQMYDKNRVLNAVPVSNVISNATMIVLMCALLQLRETLLDLVVYPL